MRRANPDMAMRMRNRWRCNNSPAWNWPVRPKDRATDSPKFNPCPARRASEARPCFAGREGEGFLWRGFRVVGPNSFHVLDNAVRVLVQMADGGLTVLVDYVIDDVSVLPG